MVLFGAWQSSFSHPGSRKHTSVSQRRHLQSVSASNNLSLMVPPAQAFLLIFHKQAALSPPCQGESLSLPVSSQIAEQVTHSLVPPECPLHKANKPPPPPLPSPATSKKRAVSMEEVSFSGKDPIQSPLPGCLCCCLVGKFHCRNGE